MTDELVLRPLSTDDAAAMVEVLADQSLYEFTGGEPPTLEELQARYQVQTRGHSADGTERWINEIVEVDGRPTGFVQATVPTAGGAAEIAWVIGRAWQGRGYARRATGLLVEALITDGTRDLIAHIHPDHTASQRIAKSLGMTPRNTVVDGEIRWEGVVQQ